MTIYIIQLLLLFIVSIYVKLIIKDRERQETVILKVMMISMWFLCSFRAVSVGNDTSGYEYSYYLSDNFDWFDFSYIYFEHGYVLLSKLFTSLGASFNTFLCFVYAGVFIPLYYFFKKHSKDATLSVLIYICYTFFTFNLSGIRNSLAMSLALVAYMLIERKTKKGLIGYFLMMALAMSIHQSSIVMFVAILIIYYPFNLKRSWLYLIVSATLIFSSHILYFISNDVLGHSIEVTDNHIGGAGLLFIVLLLFSSFLIALHPKNANELTDEKNNNLIQTIRFTHMIGFSVVSFLAIGGISTLIRAAMFFQVFITVAIPAILEMIDAKSRICIKLILIIGLIAFYYLTVLATNHLHTVPYHFFWQTPVF